MRDPIPKAILAVLAGVLLFPRVLSPAGAGGPQALVAGFVHAWNDHDAKALARLFSEDGDYVTVHGNWWKGRTWIRTGFERALATRLKTTLMVETNTTVRMVRPDVAVMRFEWEVSGELGPDGKPLLTRHGIMQIVAVEQAGAWTILSAQDTATPPPV